jgi:hypothetical protein
MAYGDYDSDDAATGENRYNNYNRNSSSAYNNNTSSSSKSSNRAIGSSSILKNSSYSNKKALYSDDDDDDNYNSGRLSSHRTNNKYDSPINSHRSDAMSAKPPSGRNQQLQPISSGRSDYSLSKKGAATTSLSNKQNDPDSDDSFMQKYQKFTKKSDQQLMDYENNYNSRSNNKYPMTKYDTYDEDEKSKKTLNSLCVC